MVEPLAESFSKNSSIPIPPPSSCHDALLSLINASDLPGLESYLQNIFPLLSSSVLEEYTGPSALRSPASAPALLLIAAARANNPEMWAVLWDTFYAPYTPLASNFESLPIQIPFPCLIAAARLGSMGLGRQFVARESGCLRRNHPEAPHGRSKSAELGAEGLSQVLAALRVGSLEYVDFMIEHGINLNAPGMGEELVRKVRMMEGDEVKIMGRVRWLRERGAGRGL